MTIKELITDSSVKQVLCIDAMGLDELLRSKVGEDAKDLMVLMAVRDDDSLDLFLSYDGRCYELDSYGNGIKTIKEMQGEKLAGTIQLFTPKGPDFFHNKHFETTIEKCLVIDTGYRDTKNLSLNNFALASISICRIQCEEVFYKHRIDSFDFSYDLLYPDGLVMGTNLVHFIEQVYENGEVTDKAYPRPRIVQNNGDAMNPLHRINEERTTILYDPNPAKLILQKNLL